MDLSPKQQEKALKVIEAINCNLADIPADVRKLLDQYVLFQQALLYREKKNQPKSIFLYSGVLYWEVHINDEMVGSIPKGATGIDAVFNILSNPQITSYRVNSLLDDTTVIHAASALQKRLMRARDTLTTNGAELLATYIKKSICISNRNNTLTYKPANNYEISTGSAVLDRS